MKNLVITAVISVTAFFNASVHNLRAAAPSLVWQAAFGGSQSDIPYEVKPRPGGGVYLAGESASSNGNKTSPAYGGKDIWVLALDSSGSIIWDRSFGGLGDDTMFALEPVSNNRLLLVGASASPISGDKSSPSFGLRDYWIILLDMNGNKVWEKTFGGSDDDYATSVVELSDGSFLVGGYSRSLDGGSGNKTARLWGQGDVWILRLDAQGNQLWDRSYGGTGDDGAFGMVRLENDSVVISANSDSGISGNKTTPNYGFYDVWTLKLDSSGNILWARSFGGDSDDGYYAVPIAKSADGGVVLACDSFSGVSGNKTVGNFGQDDFWVLKLDTNGNRLWETNCGGAFNDYPLSIAAKADGTIIIGGGSNSSPNSGNRTAAGFGSTDFWLMALDPAGKPLWDTAVGGSSEDAFLGLSLALDPDGSIYCVGDSISGAAGAKTVAPFGSYDFWLVKLGASAIRPSLRVPAQDNIAQYGFRLFLSGQTGKSYRVDYTTNWTSWLPLSTNSVTTGEVSIIDLGAKTNTTRFYRAMELP